MKCLFLIINLLIFSHLAFPQNPEEDIFTHPIETQPEPPEGMDKFYQFIAQNLQYPPEAKAKKIQGKVFVQFIVQENGKLTDFKIFRGIGYGCDEEAIRVLQKSPPWKPATQPQRNRVIKMQMFIPIFFKLD